MRGGSRGKHRSMPMRPALWLEHVLRCCHTLKDFQSLPLALFSSTRTLKTLSSNYFSPLFLPRFWTFLLLFQEFLIPYLSHPISQNDGWENHFIALYYSLWWNLEELQGKWGCLPFYNIDFDIHMCVYLFAFLFQHSLNLFYSSNRFWQQKLQGSCQQKYGQI